MKTSCLLTDASDSVFGQNVTPEALASPPFLFVSAQLTASAIVDEAFVDVMTGPLVRAEQIALPAVAHKATDLVETQLLTVRVPILAFVNILDLLIL
jgi:hypothetical protein